MPGCKKQWNRNNAELPDIILLLNPLFCLVQ